MIMRVVYLILPLVVLTACGSNNLKGYDGPKAMERQEVVHAARECINGKMKPEVEYLSQKTSFGLVSIPINVHCNPYVR
jgi:hypothetical protein